MISANTKVVMGETGEGKNEIQSKIDELIEEGEKLKQDEERTEKSEPFESLLPEPSMLFRLYPPEKCREQIDC